MVTWASPFGLSAGGHATWPGPPCAAGSRPRRRLPTHRWGPVLVPGPTLASAFVSDLGLRFPGTASSGLVHGELTGVVWGRVHVH